MDKKGSIKTTIFLLISVFFAAVIYLTRMFIPVSSKNQLTETLFSAFEIVASIAIGYFIQQNASKKEFQDSLKKMALSAYRRITDIEKALFRLFIEIEKIRSSSPQEIKPLLGLLLSMGEGIKETIQSSMDDWIEILEEDLKKKDKLEMLEEQRQVIENKISKDESNSNDLQAIKNQITNLRSELPSLLLQDAGTYPRAGRISKLIIQILFETLNTNRTLPILISPRLHQGMEESKITGSRIFTFTEEVLGMHHYAITVSNEFGELGEVKNPYSEIYSHDYLFSLIRFLEMIKERISSDTEIEKFSHTIGKLLSMESYGQTPLTLTFEGQFFKFISDENSKGDTLRTFYIFIKPS